MSVSIIQAKDAPRAALSVQSPDLRDKAEFSIEMPVQITEEFYRLVRANLEFRRKCMNQGFDNLLELLDMHWQANKKTDEATPSTS